nr:DNA methyltransferase [Bacillus sp. 28A-2]
MFLSIYVPCFCIKEAIKKGGRKDIVWNKPNDMPESVRDRPTSSHEYIFLLSKSQKYYYDHEAIKEAAYKPFPVLPRGSKGAFGMDHNKRKQASWFIQRIVYDDVAFRAIRNKRNKRSVWTVASQPKTCTLQHIQWN